MYTCIRLTSHPVYNVAFSGRKKHCSKNLFEKEILMDKNTWYEQVRRDTLHLIHIKSVSPGPGEIEAAHAVLDLLCLDNAAPGYTAYGLDPLQHDPYARQNVFAFIQGQSLDTIVLLAHFDTVDTTDYGDLADLALDPEQLTALPNIQNRLTRGSPPPASETASDWLFGRGTSDMKTGVAIHLALMRHYARKAQTEPLPLSLIFLATPDEENESAGVLQATHFLTHLRAQYGLTYLGLLNTDYTTPLYPDDPHHYIYAGSVGKLLPSFLCLGRESHVGHPFNGLDANLLTAELIRDLSMNDELCDSVRGQVTAPPVTLHATDLKTHYDVQLPFASYFYLNVLTLSTTPDALLERLRAHAQRSLTAVAQRVAASEHRWHLRSNLQYSAPDNTPTTPLVLSYHELYTQTAQTLGVQRVEKELQMVWKTFPHSFDSRERSLSLVYHLWMLSELPGPAIVIYYAPPYYPHVSAATGPFQDAIEAVVADHPEEQLVIREFYPYLSDMSYLRLDPGTDVAQLKANMPLWSAPSDAYPGAYYLPLEAIQQLNIPVVNWGIYGRGAHQRDECVQMSYSFGSLPQLLYETIETLAARLYEKYL
jgi:arginine utilization protein RocB